MDRDALAQSPTGDIWVAPGLIALAEPEDAWLGMRELHFAAIGDRIDFRTGAGDLSPADALSAYGSSVAAVLGQIGVTTPQAGDNLLGSLCTAAEMAGGFDGLEAPALAAYQSAGRSGVTAEMERFSWLAGTLGMPERSGGGVDTSAVFDVGTRALGLPDIGTLRDAVTTAASPGDLLERVGGLARDMGIEFGPEVTHFAAAVEGAAASAATGAEIGGLIGSVLPGVGTGAGAVIGGIIGFFAGLLGGGDGPDRDHASGDKVAVHADIRAEAPGGTPLATDRDGQVKPTPAAAGSAPPPYQGTCVPASPAKCQVADGSLVTDLPYWADRVGLAPAAIPVGAGRDGLFTASAAGAPVLGALPVVDEAGAMQFGGVLDDLLVPAVRGPRLPTEVGAGRVRVPGDLIDAAWVAVAARTPELPAVSRGYRQYLIDGLRARGISPHTPVRQALRQLTGGGYGR